MSAHSSVSKQIGWEVGSSPRIPSVQDAVATCLVAADGDVHAYAVLFGLWRFLPSDNGRRTPAEQAAVDICREGFSCIRQAGLFDGDKPARLESVERLVMETRLRYLAKCPRPVDAGY